MRPTPPPTKGARLREGLLDKTNTASVVWADTAYRFFTNGKEEEVGLTGIVPFLVEDEMLKLGAIFSKKANWAPHVVSDGLLITGQNPHRDPPPQQSASSDPPANRVGNHIAQITSNGAFSHSLGPFLPFIESDRMSAPWRNADQSFRALRRLSVVLGLRRPQGDIQ